MPMPRPRLAQHDRQMPIHSCPVASKIAAPGIGADAAEYLMHQRDHAGDCAKMCACRRRRARTARSAARSPGTSSRTRLQTSQSRAATGRCRSARTPQRAARTTPPSATPAPVRSLHTPPAIITPISPVSPITASRLPASKAPTPRSCANATTWVVTKKSSSPQIAKMIAQQPELPRPRRLAQRHAGRRRARGVGRGGSRRPGMIGSSTTSRTTMRERRASRYTERQPTAASTSASPAIITSCPTVMPDTATALTSPALARAWRASPSRRPSSSRCRHCRSQTSCRRAPPRATARRHQTHQPDADARKHQARPHAAGAG